MFLGVSQEHLAAGRMKNCNICSIFVDGQLFSFYISTGQIGKGSSMSGEACANSKAKYISTDQKGIKRKTNHVVRRNRP